MFEGTFILSKVVRMHLFLFSQCIDAYGCGDDGGGGETVAERHPQIRGQSLPAN
ncbi:MAG: hypothetical protein COB33_007030 [Thiotrichaceae bacterium]|nr:hypothetical protein [Thiotrichaceae bacterium]